MEKSKKIYLDNASATPIDNRVLSVMTKISKEIFANASAIHDLGITAKNKLEQARKEIATILNAHTDEIIFTSGSTESNNLAIRGILEILKNSTVEKDFIPHIITTNIEHASVLEVCKYLEKNKKAELTYVPVESNGIIEPKKMRKALRSNTVLVSVMYANNEIGTVQPIQEIAKEIRYFNKVNNKKVLLHTDATQAVNYLLLNVEKLGVDLMSFNSGKIYGPKGVGVLFIKRRTEIGPILFGGEQEFNFRPGTENLVNIVGLAEALKITEKIKEKEIRRLISLRDYFIGKLLELSADLKINININGDLKNRLANNVNITIPKIPSELLVLELSARGIYVSEKSACKSGDKKSSHVIRAITGKNIGSVRFSLGRQTKKEDLDYAIKALSQILKKLEKWYY
ncbi:MAG TPA: cysteine desulfurase family protein [Candidatus Paceibacterota bacterium]|nr:cysteine desulfurase family protein [Candidatus Paceibacterota bacterium]